MQLHNSDDPRENAKVFFGLVLLIVLAYAGFVLKPALGELKAQRESYAKLVQQVGVGRAKANELAGFAGKVAALRAQVTQIENRLSAEKAMPLLLRDAQRAAKVSGVKIASITPGGLTTRSGYSERSISLTLHTSTAGLSQFVSRLESLPYVVRVDSADVKTGSLTASGKLEVTLGATMYSLEKGGEPQREPSQSVVLGIGAGANGGSTGS